MHVAKDRRHLEMTKAQVLHVIVHVVPEYELIKQISRIYMRICMTI